MKVNVLFEENEMCLRAQSQRDLEFLHKMQGIHTPGPWAHAEFSNLTFEELGFDPKDAGKQYALQGLEPCVMAWVRLKLDWLTYAQPAPADSQLRAEAAKRIGYRVLDIMKLVAIESKVGTDAASVG